MTVPTNQKDFLLFVESQLEKMPKLYTIDPKNIDLREVEKSLLVWNMVYERLGRMLVEAKANQTNAEEAFEMFCATKRNEIRLRENTPDKKGSQWLSVNQIEDLMKVENTKEYLKLHNEKETCKQTVDYLKSRLSSWESYQFVLSTTAKIESNKMSAFDIGSNVANKINENIPLSINSSIFQN